MLRRYLFTFTLILMFALSCFAGAQDTAQAQAGLALYKAYYCGVCHQSTVAETGGIFGPGHDGLAVIAQARILDPNYHGTADTVEDYVRESIVEPQLYTVPGYAMTRHHMPSYRYLTEDELEELIYFLLHQDEVATGSD
jgi:cytochrome c551/c552